MDKIDNLAKIKEDVYCCGGKEKAEMQHNLDKLTARERILRLLDEGSFIEVGALLEDNGAGVIGGYGTVNGKLVYTYSYDYTVNGGALTKKNSEKICKIIDMAAKVGAPIVQIFDSIGAKLSEGLDILGSYGNIINKNAKLSGVVPQISIIAGPTVGMAALNASMSDFVVMIKETGEMGISTSKSLTNVEGTYVDSKLFSNAENCSKSGLAQIVAENEQDAMNKVRELIEYIPSNNAEMAPIGEEDAKLNVLNDKLNEMCNEGNLDIDLIISEIADNNKVIGLYECFSKSVVTKLVKVNGLTVGVIGNKAENSAYLDKNACDKLIKFVRLCDNFNISIVSIVNNKGFKVSLEEEKNGLATYGAKLLQTLSSADIGKVALVVGEAFGAAYLTLASKEVAFDATYAWPSAKIALGNPESMVRELYRDEIAKATNPREAEGKIIGEHINEVTDVYVAARAGYVDDVIMPSETKPRLFAMLDMLQSKRELKYPRKHNMNLI